MLSPPYTLLCLESKAIFQGIMESIDILSVMVLFLTPNTDNVLLKPEI